MDKICPKCQSKRFCLYPYCGKDPIKDAAWEWYYEDLTREERKDLNDANNNWNPGVDDIVKLYKEHKQ